MGGGFRDLDSVGLGRRKELAHLNAMQVVSACLRSLLCGVRSGGRCVETEDGNVAPRAVGFVSTSFHVCRSHLNNGEH